MHLINNLEREGAQVVVFNLATSTVSADLQHLVCARQAGGPLQAAFESCGVAVFAPRHYHRAFAVRRSLKFIERVIDGQAVDVIHAHMADAAFLGWLAAMRCGLPLMITHHGYHVVPRCGLLCRAVYTVLLALAARYARRNIAVSAGVADRLCRAIRLKPDRIDVIVNGVPVPADDGTVYERKPLAPAGPRIVTVGRLVDLKGHEQLIAAASALVERYPTVRLFFVGDGPLRPRLEQQVRSNGLTDVIVFTGLVEDVPARLSEADVYVSTSYCEGMPVAVLEAMAAGVPVVASDVPGNREVVVHETTGLLYEADDINGLVNAICRVVERTAEARERVRRARCLVRDRYSVNGTAQAYERLYTAVSEGATR